MRWQRVAQAAIAIFVIGFVVVLVLTLRREAAGPAQQEPAPPRVDTDAVIENPGGCEQIIASGGKRLFTLKCGKHSIYKDGRQRLAGNVEVALPRGDREFIIKSDEAEILPKEDGIAQAIFKGNVRVTSEGGLQVTAGEATYTDSDGMLKIPGPVEFAKGRMKGAGVNATYDRNREVLWILEQARITVAADPKGGSGAAQGSADAIGVARADHFIRLLRNGQLSAEGRLLQADDIVIRLSDDDQRMRSMELRGNSRITGGSGGPQAMSARDIDLTYAEDGRTLQASRLVENAVVQLAAAGPGRRISGRTIDIGMAPDGSTVTSLNAHEAVQVDLPAEGQAPAKRIRAAALAAQGPAGAGLQNATFTGGVEYREIGPSGQKGDRTARSDTLMVDTKPGLGAIERADFRGNVRFTEADLVGVAPQGVYFIAKDRLDLLPGEGLPGPPPLVTDARLSVSARTIGLTLSTRELLAETKVRSTMQPQKKNGGEAGKVPSMLKQDAPVNVTANRLRYSGSGSQAVYSGNATLWQEPETQIRADTITIDDKSGNLSANGTVDTLFTVEEIDRKSNAKRRTATRGSADTFTYDDARRVATYSGKAHISGAQGDIRGQKIELFMKSGANELERAEAHGPNVVVKEGSRMATGSHLTYTAADDRYLMVGTPVEIIEERNGTCTQTLGATATFNRTTEAAGVEGNQTTLSEARTLPACPPALKR